MASSSSSIFSFDERGRDRLIEVKTTNGSARTPFYLSRNERQVADERPEEMVYLPCPSVRQRATGLYRRAAVGSVGSSPAGDVARVLLIVAGLQALAKPARTFRLPGCVSDQVRLKRGRTDDLADMQSHTKHAVKATTRENRGRSLFQENRCLSS